MRRFFGGRTPGAAAAPTVVHSGPPPTSMPVLVGNDDAERAFDGVDRSDDPRRVAGDEHAGGHVGGDHAAGADQRVLADGDQRQQRHVDADAGPAPDGRSLHALGANRVRIVGDCHARRQEHVVFDRRELGDVDVAVDLDAVADHAAVVDRRIVPERAVAADPVLLADDRVMPGLEILADVDRGIDDRAGADAGGGADPGVAVDARASGRIPEQHAADRSRRRRRDGPSTAPGTSHFNGGSSRRIDASIAASVRTTPIPKRPGTSGGRLLERSRRRNRRTGSSAARSARPSG